MISSKRDTISSNDGRLSGSGCQQVSIRLYHCTPGMRRESSAAVTTADPAYSDKPPIRTRKLSGTSSGIGGRRRSIQTASTSSTRDSISPLKIRVRVNKSQSQAETDFRLSHSHIIDRHALHTKDPRQSRFPIYKSQSCRHRLSRCTFGSSRLGYTRDHSIQ